MIQETCVKLHLRFSNFHTLFPRSFPAIFAYMKYFLLKLEGTIKGKKEHKINMKKERESVKKE